MAETVTWRHGDRDKVAAPTVGVGRDLDHGGRTVRLRSPNSQPDSVYDEGLALEHLEACS